MPPHAHDATAGAETSVLVVVVLHNSGGVLGPLVDSLPRGMGDLRYDVVFVDNSSSDGSPDTARRLLPDATVVEVGFNSGYAAAINRGVGAGLGGHDAVLVLNPDVRLAPGCGPALARALRRPGIGIAYPRLRDGEGRLLPSLRRRPTLLRMLADALIGGSRAARIGRLGETVGTIRAYTTGHVVDWGEGAALMVSRSCWERVGAWDETFFLYSEETDFALRAGDVGLRGWYEPAADAVHLRGGSEGNPRLWPLVSVNRVRLYRKRHGPLAAALFHALVLLRELSRAATGNAASRAAVGYLVDPRRARAQPTAEWIEGRGGAWADSG